MTKLSNAAKKSTKLSLNLSKRIVLDASDKPVTKIALDASDKPVTLTMDKAPDQTFSEEVATGNMMGEGAPDFEREVEETAPENVQSDPMAPYSHHMVKLSYVFDGMELDVGRIFRGWEASQEAHTRANDKTGPKVPVAIRCATSNELFFTVYPVKGARNVSIVSDTRQTSTRTVTKVGMSEEEKARIEAERQRKEEERLAKIEREKEEALNKARQKAEGKRQKLLIEVASNISEISQIVNKGDTRFEILLSLKEQVESLAIGISSADLDKLKTYSDNMVKLAQTSKDLAKAFKSTARHPKIDSDAYNNFLLLTREIGATCKELNHEHNLRSGLTNANFGWKQIALDMEKKFTYRLIAMGRQCQVAEKKGLSEAMRLIDRDLEIPAGWVDISRF
jgi:hypothetical protein